MHDFSYLKDCDGLSPFGLGGVVNGENEESSDDIEASITYKTPFVVNGREVLITLGLGKNVACNSIISWPFMQSLKASLITDSKVLILGLIGAVLPYENMVPLRANVAPANAAGVPPSFLTRPSSFTSPMLVAQVEELRKTIDQVKKEVYTAAPVEHTRATRPSSSGFSS